VRYASEHNLGRRMPDDEIEPAVRAVMWDPSYVPIHSIPAATPGPHP